MPPTDRSSDNLTKLMVESLEFLRISCEGYDAGREAEAKRLAVTLRVLLHDTKTSHSLLSQLRLKEKLAFFDSGPEVQPDNIVSTLGLAVTYNSGNGDLPGPYFAPKDDMPPGFIQRRSPFAAWWTRAVAKEYTGTEWTRQMFVLELANKEGGAHVDPKMTARYRQLIEENGLGVTFTTATGETIEPRDSYILASVRQIAHEVLKTAARPAYNYPAAST